MNQAFGRLPKTALLARVEAMATTCADTSLVVLAREDDDVHRLDFAGHPAPLPAFCAMMRTADGGCRQCLACRRLILLSATFRGLTTYSCHGGIQIMAAPVEAGGDGQHVPLAVASAAFAQEDREQGWRAVRNQARHTKLDLAKLRDAYHALPVLTESNKQVLHAVVDVAAAAVAASLQQTGRPETLDASGTTRESHVPAIRHELKTALSMSRNGAFEAPGCAKGAALTDLVTAMVAREPGLPFTVANVARAASMTPNHFSAVFHKHTGRTFVTFLTEKRLEHAKSLLNDPTRSVQEIAQAAGFQDTAYFSRRFRQLTGQSPSEWRESPNTTKTAIPAPPTQARARNVSKT